MITVNIIKTDNYEELEIELNQYLATHLNALIKYIDIKPRGNSDKELCYAVLVEVSD